MSKELEALVECPFFVKHGKDFIVCEGLCDTGKTTHSFRAKSAKTEHIVNVCCSNSGRKCPHYRAVSLLYERGLRH